MKRKTIILLAIVVLLILIQLIRVDQTNPESNPKYDYFVVESVPANAQAIIRESCYDCHSNQTVYPWYSKIAPASWFLQNHINEGRHEFNYSEWGNYSSKDKKEMLEDMIKMIDEDEMPLKSYLLIHRNARLTDEEKTILRQLFLKESATGAVASLN